MRCPATGTAASSAAPAAQSIGTLVERSSRLVLLVKLDKVDALLRQYLPKRTDLKVHSQAELDAIALELNGRPRQTLEFMTPSQKFAEAVALTP